MLTIITGLPGHGKTLFAINKIPELYKDREIFYHGIDDLKLPWTLLDDPQEWFKLPDGSVIVIDEAQQYFPLRQPSKDVPIYCSKFETHRHKGLDIILITQDAMLIDHHVRRLAGQHTHVVRIRTGHQAATIYTGAKVFNPNDYHQKLATTKETFRYPKESYKNYKSAEIHTVKTNIPFRLILFPAIILMLVVGAYFSFGHLTSMGENSVELATESMPDNGGSFSPAVNRSAIDGQITTEQYIDQRTPRIQNIPWSAPIYDAARVVNTYPKPNCIRSNKKCQCYSQQATKLNIDEETCKLYIETGYFDPTKGKRREKQKGL